MRYSWLVGSIGLLISIAHAQRVVQIAEGQVSGVQHNSGVNVFLGIPYAKPPIGELRWEVPLPVNPWTGVRSANAFAPRCMQNAVATDIVSRAPSISEDCLYLNVWTPKVMSDARLPVLFYIYGGGFQSGDGSERRYDGEAIAREGIVVVTLNYRLGVFGFLSLLELSKESSTHTSGNYGLMDQLAALQWVHRNIAEFGGDPEHVTIAGESAGSMSVSALMGSPLTKGLMVGAIGESGSSLAAQPAMPSLQDAEEKGLQFEQSVGANSLANLRAMSAESIENASTHPAAAPAAERPRGLRFAPIVDGVFLPKPLAQIYAAGEQSRVPLLAGSNSEEGGYNTILGPEAPTLQNYKKALEKRFHEDADRGFQMYSASRNGDSVLNAAQTLSSDLFIAYGTWEWMSLATKTGGQPTYYYYYTHRRPALRPEALPYFKSWWTYNFDGKTYPRAMPRGAVHSAEIEYALGNLDGNDVYSWTPADYKVSRTLKGYFVNFIKTGNPNGAGLLQWPTYAQRRRMHINVVSRSELDDVRDRYEFLGSTLFKH